MTRWAPRAGRPSPTPSGAAPGSRLTDHTAWEVATLVRKGRYRLTVSPKVWFARLLDLPGVRLAGMASGVLIDSALLPGEPPTDPADRIIAATARDDGFAIVTRDQRLIAYGEQRHVRILAC